MSILSLSPYASSLTLSFSTSGYSHLRCSERERRDNDERTSRVSSERENSECVRGRTREYNQRANEGGIGRERARVRERENESARDSASVRAK